MSKKYEMTFELNGDIDPRLMRRFDELGKDAIDLGRDLDSLKRSKGLGELRKDAGKASGAFDELRENAEEFGDILGRVAQYTGAFKLIEGVAGSIDHMVSTVGDFEGQVGDLAAATGASGKELQQLNDISKSMYTGGFGDSVNDLTEALVISRNVTKQTGEELEKTATNAIILRDVFQFDVPESVKAADTMMRQFGITSEQSMNLLAQGAQKGLDKSGELLDSANEYAPQFASLGYSAQEMFDFFAQGLEAGVWNLDKVGDLAKEFNIRIQDGSEKTADALAALLAPEGIEDFAAALKKGGVKSVEYMHLMKSVGSDSAKELVKSLQKGGKAAEKAILTISGAMGGGDKILADLSSGALKGKDVMQQVISELNMIEDPVYRNILGVELFGTQWEDLEKDVVKSLGSVRNQFDMTQTTMEDMSVVKYSDLKDQLTVLGRELMDEIIIPIGEELMPTLHGITDWASDNKDLIKTLALAVPAGMLTKSAVSMGKDLASVGKAMFNTAQGASGFGRVVGLMSNPIGIAVGAVGALTAGVIAYKNHQEKARQALLDMGSELREASSLYDETAIKAKKTNDLVWTYNDLSEAIKNSSGNSELLVSQQKKLADVTAELQRLHPNTITQYDIENGRVKDKVGLLKREADAERELSRLRLEKAVAEGKLKMPELQKQLSSLMDSTEKLQLQKSAIDMALPALKEFQVEYQKIQQMEYNDKSALMLEDLRKRVDAVGDTVGWNFDLAVHLDTIGQAISDLEDDQISTLDKFITKNEELQKATNSVQEIYDQQIALIEIDLGGPVEEMISKYGQFDDKLKTTIDAAKAKILELNEAAHDLEVPVEKMVTIGVHWKQFGDLSAPRPGVQSMQAYADGGYADKPSIFGEAGPEMAIPIRKDQRSRNLHALTGRLLGVGASTAGEQTTIHFKPNIKIDGGGSDVQQQVISAMQMSLREFEILFKQMQRNRERVGLTGE